MTWDERKVGRARFGEIAFRPLFAGALFLGACGGGGNNTEGTASGCKATRTTVASDELTPVGFSGDQLLATAEGSYTGTLSWQPVDPNEVDTNVKAGETPLSVRVTRNGDVRFLDQSNEGPTTIGCPDGVEVDVEVAVTTEDGLLAETRPGYLIGWSAAESNATFTFNDVPPSGTLRAEPVPSSGLTLEFFSLGATFGPDGAHGAIVLGLEGRTADTKFLKNVPLGIWTSLDRVE